MKNINVWLVALCVALFICLCGTMYAMYHTSQRVMFVEDDVSITVERIDSTSANVMLLDNNGILIDELYVEIEYHTLGMSSEEELDLLIAEAIDRLEDTHLTHYNTIQ